MKVIAIDAGGTSTKFVLYDYESEEKVDQLSLSTCHILQVGKENMIKILREGIDLLRIKNDILSENLIISFGLAGYGKDHRLRNIIEEAIAENFSDYKYLLHNDVEIALKAAFPKEDGIILISGTGSIAYRKLGLSYIRSGGWGYKLGDEGSGYWIGNKALEYFTKQADGRIDKTNLYRGIRDYYKLDNDFDLISIRKDLSRNEIASLSILVTKLAKEGDKYCKIILDEAASELSLLVRALNSEDEAMEVALIGGIFSAGYGFRKLLKRELGDKYTIEKSKNPPEYGAFLLAKEESFD